jgi:hypothetical protein
MPRRRFVYRPGHEKASSNGFVEVTPDVSIEPIEEKALHAPILTGRFFENQSTIDGKDIGSRTKFKNYMKEAGVTHSSDYSEKFFEEQKASKERADAKDRREAVSKAWWQHLER